jgi:peroxiredoxin
MKNFYRCLVVLVCALQLASCTRAGESGTNPGDLAPDFSVRDLDGKPAKLSDYKGKVILLNFWASWCEPCLSEMPALERMYAKLRDKGFAVVAVGMDDTPTALKEFKDRLGLSFPILVDSSGQTKMYKVHGFPESFIIDRSGKLVMIQDPESDDPVVRIVGPREWDSPNSISRIEALLK